MNEPELQAIKDALPRAQRRVRVMLETGQGNLLFLNARWTAEDCKPIIDAAPAMIAEIERLHAENERLRRDGCYPLPQTEQ